MRVRSAFGEAAKDEDFERHRKMLPRESLLSRAYDGDTAGQAQLPRFPFRADGAGR